MSSRVGTRETVNPRASMRIRASPCVSSVDLCVHLTEDAQKMDIDIICTSGNVCTKVRASEKKSPWQPMFKHTL